MKNAEQDREIELECIQEEKDLGVIIDSKLKFDSHINEKVKTANKIMGVIRRSFEHLDQESFVYLFKGLVRPHLEYANQVWNPFLKKHINLIEKVQRRATKLIPGMKELTYTERLQKLKLPTLVYRRARGNMIEMYKILTGVYDKKVASFIEVRDPTENRTRGHELKIFQKGARLMIRKNAFGVRNAQLWNSLPTEAIQAKSVKSFENRLDKFWRNQAVIYDYEATFNGSERTSKEDYVDLDIEDGDNLRPVDDL